MYNLQGFKEIPGFSNYVINRDGVIVSKLTGVVLSVNVNGAGYLCVSINNDAGRRQGLGIHRALALTYIPCNGNSVEMVVNHKDGNKQNNALDNLEWVSYQGNAEHAGAIGLTSKCTPMSIRDEDGNVLTFKSYIHCARFLGVSKDAIRHRVNTKGNVRFADGYQYRSGVSDDPWPEPITRAVAVELLSEKKLLIFDSKKEIADFLKISAATVTMRLKQPVSKVYPDNTRVGYLSDFIKLRKVRP